MEIVERTRVRHSDLGYTIMLLNELRLRGIPRPTHLFNKID